MDDGAFTYLVDTEGCRLSFRRDFDRMPFAFAHRFHISDHFSLDALRDLAVRMAQSKIAGTSKKEIPRPRMAGALLLPADRLKRVLRTLAIIAPWLC